MLRTFAGLACLGTIAVSAALGQVSDAPAALAAPANPTPAAVPSGCQPSVELSGDCPAAGTIYAETEFLLWWFKPVCLNVPVITLGSPAAAVPGAIGQPGTQILVGGTPPHHFDFGATPGIDIKLGWLRSDGALGAEVSGFRMARSSATQAFFAAPDGSPATYLAYQATDNSQKTLPFTVPGSVTGASVATGSTQVWGVEANLLVPMTVDRGSYSLYGAFLVGARYLDLTDKDQIFNRLSLVNDPAAFAFGADQVTTHNQFAGPQAGATLGFTWGKWSLQYTTKLAAGVTNQTREIQGSPLLVTTVPSAMLVPGPLIALPSNFGKESAGKVTLVPEVGLKSRLALTSWCSLTMGYRLIYWNKVLCPGDQMDPMVNITQLPFHGPVTGPLAPSSGLVHTDYFAQGIELGVQFRY